jgi:hypothetical protein
MGMNGCVYGLQDGPIESLRVQMRISRLDSRSVVKGLDAKAIGYYRSSSNLKFEFHSNGYGHAFQSKVCHMTNHHFFQQLYHPHRLCHMTRG